MSRRFDVWESTNKILMGGKQKKVSLRRKTTSVFAAKGKLTQYVSTNLKRPHARNPNFETEETKLLISLWGDPVVQKTLITTHKKYPVIAKLAEKMREYGYLRSAEEINTRIKNLKCFYNRIKKDLDSGIISEPSWKHYAALDEIITRPVFGNRVQQPHLLNRPKPPEIYENNFDEDDSNGIRPEDLLSLEAESDPDDGSLIPKEEPVDIDDVAQQW